VSDNVSPFAEWDGLRDAISPFIGERALSLFAFSIFDEADGLEGAAYFRELLAESGTVVDDPQVTETERLLIDWGRFIARDAGSVPADVQDNFDRTFRPQLRELLTKFAALTVATAIAQKAQG
jgi:hypothetical protein